MPASPVCAHFSGNLCHYQQPADSSVYFCSVNRIWEGAASSNLACEPRIKGGTEGSVESDRDNPLSVESEIEESADGAHGDNIPKGDRDNDEG